VGGATTAARPAAGPGPVPQPLPSDVAALVGRHPGEAHLGAWS
jgi:hypothetical protein